MVMLEAGALGIPVVGFERSGGIVEYVADETGIAVPFLDIEAFAEALAFLAKKSRGRRTHGRRGEVPDRPPV